MKMMVKHSLILLMLFALVAPVAAKGPSNVRNTVHNMSSSAPGTLYTTFYISDEAEVCIFCHTPHGGSLTGPLWNRPDPTSAWQFYDSATISSEVKNNVTQVNDESLLCLSCHDGSVSVYHLLNYGASTTITEQDFGVDGSLMFMPGTPGANPRIGGNLADPNNVGQLGDDHPISFSYDAVYAEYLGASKPGLKDPTTMSSDIRFFGANRRVECSTCHDPHVDYVSNPTFAPFLNMSNSGSAMCIECHDK